MKLSIKVNNLRAEIVNRKGEVLAAADFQTLDKRPNWKELATRVIREKVSADTMKKGRVRVVFVSSFGC